MIPLYKMVGAMLDAARQNLSTMKTYAADIDIQYEQGRVDALQSVLRILKQK